MWPRLDRAALRRCKDDPHRIAALVARRTSLPRESIVQMLTLPPVSSDDGAIWFGLTARRRPPGDGRLPKAGYLTQVVQRKS